MKPPLLKPGDTIGIISPSWGGAGLFPHRVEQGIHHLEALGFRVKLAPNALSHMSFISDTPENRASDIHTLFGDPTVNGILAAIGGDHACHLLPLLDFDLIRLHPKVFMGFSDVTVLNLALYKKTGLVTFNGPALLTDFAEWPNMLDYTRRYFLQAVSQPGPIGAIQPAQMWTEEFQDWTGKKDQERPRQLQLSAGWSWLKPGQAEGRLVGGCLESMEHLRGTPYWPDWEGTILFIETSEERPLPETVDGILMDYQNMGVFDRIRGLLVGRPMRYTVTEKQALRDCVIERTKAFSFPVVMDMDFGHTAPQFTLPIGCLAHIDSDQKSFSILEPAVE
jgi:muramoyltetrapeptide carboxypeptidase LdcA involved in peptidoglycan recycling